MRLLRISGWILIGIFALIGLPLAGALAGWFGGQLIVPIPPDGHGALPVVLFCSSMGFVGLVIGVVCGMEVFVNILEDLGA